MDIEHIMPRRQAGPQPTWTDVKAKLASFDRLAFLHARFELGKDVLKPYKETLQRWLSPDVLRNQDPSVVKAKQAISGYTKAVGEPAGLAELMVFYCERAAGFCNDVGYHETSYSNSLVRMFQEALKIISKLSDSDRKPLISRLDEVRATNHLGYWVGDTMDDLLAEYVGCEPLLVG